jgi:hypothetical protein
VNARVPQNKPPYVHSAPFSDRREPTFELPVREGQRGNTYDLGNALLKPVAVYVQGAQVVRQPRDGHCLYHALIHGLGHTLSILDLRKELSEFVRKNPGLIAHGHPLSTWIMWECHCRCVCVCVRVSVCLPLTFKRFASVLTSTQEKCFLIVPGAAALNCSPSATPGV